MLQNLSSQLESSLVIPPSKYGSYVIVASELSGVIEYSIAPVSSNSRLKKRFVFTCNSIPFG